MDLLKKRAELIARQRELVNSAKAENRGFNEEEDKQFNDLTAEIESLDKLIEAERAVAGLESNLDQPLDPLYRPKVVPGDEPVDKKDDGGFKNLGEFINAVRFGDSKGRLQNVTQGEDGGFKIPDAFIAAIMPGRVMNEWSMGTGEEGGFAVPVQRRDTILMLQPEGSIVRPRASVIPAGDPPDSEITMPAFSQGAKGAYGGVTVDWINEGGDKPETDGKLQEISLKPHEVAAHTVVTDKLLRNWQAANSFISNLLRGAVRNAEDLKFLKGAGVGTPIGVLNAGGLLAVNRAKASEIAYADVASMLEKFLPDSGNGVWVAHQSTLAQLLQLQDGNGRYIFIGGDATKGIPATLAGLPIVFTGKTAALGSTGDLLLVDFSYYLIKDGSGPFVAASEHVYFKQNKTVIKVFWNVDGKGWVNEPLTLEDGSTKVSPYIALDVPKE